MKCNATIGVCRNTIGLDGNGPIIARQSFTVSLQFS